MQISCKAQPFATNHSYLRKSESEADTHIGLPLYLVIPAKALGNITIKHARRRQSIGTTQCQFCPGITKVLIHGRGRFIFCAECRACFSAEFMEQACLQIEITAFRCFPAATPRRPMKLVMPSWLTCIFFPPV